LVDRRVPHGECWESKPDKTGLKAAQVRALLGRSTDKVGPEPYVGAGGGHNDRYGYGRINARKAVDAAVEWIFGDGFQ
jgi:hypothetical protein